MNYTFRHTKRRFDGSILLVACLANLSLAACGPSDSERAAVLLADAEAAYDDARTNEALLLLDSIEASCPHAIDARRAARQLHYRITLDTERRTLQQTDSLIDRMSHAIDSVANLYFDFVKTEYDEVGRFVPHGTSPEQNVARSYIRATVDEYGVTQLISTYSGDTNLGHTSLCITATDGTRSTTASVPYDDGANYRYEILGTKYESVTYVSHNITRPEKGGTDGGTLAFVAIHPDDGLQATLTGGKRDLKVNISAAERRSLVATYELGVMLRERLRLTQEHKVAEDKIAWLVSKLSQ